MISIRIQIMFMGYACLVALRAFCMDQPLTIGKKLQTICAAARAADLKPKSLYQYFKIESLSHAPKDIKQLLAKTIVGRSGWWYKKAALKDVAFPMQVALHPQATQAVIVNKFFPGIETEKAMLWDLESNQVTQLPVETVLAAAFNRQGTQIALSTMHGTVHILDLTGALLDSIVVQGWFDRIAFNDQGTMITDGSSLLNLLSKKTIELKLGNGHDTAVAFHPTHETEFAVGVYRTNYPACAYVVDTARKQYSELPHEAKYVDFIAYNADGTKVATQSKFDNMLCVWTFVGKELEQTALNDEVVGDIVFHDDGGYIASQYACRAQHALLKDKDPNVHIRDFKGNDVITFPCNKYVHKMKFNPIGSALLVACLEEYAVWQKYTALTLDQVLLRIVLEDYSKGCKYSGQSVGFTGEQLEIVPHVIAKKFNILEDDVVSAWQSFPLRLQKSIVATLLVRASVE